jgi:hypothetical protein
MSHGLLIQRGALTGRQPDPGTGGSPVAGAPDLHTGNWKVSHHGGRHRLVGASQQRKARRPKLTGQRSNAKSKVTSLMGRQIENPFDGCSLPGFVRSIQLGSRNEVFRAGIKREWRMAGYLPLTTPRSRSTLFHQRGSALANFLERHFEATKFLRTQFREHSLHLPGMLSKG